MSRQTSVTMVSHYVTGCDKSIVVKLCDCVISHLDR